MPLSEKEEFELLSLEREKAGSSSPGTTKSQLDLQPKTWEDAFKKVGLSPKMDVGEAVPRRAYEAGGFATDVMSRLGASPETAAKVGFGTNVGIQSIPMLLGGSTGEQLAGTVGQSASKGLDSLARRWMQQALKPKEFQLMAGKSDKAIDTMLKEGINVSRGGVEKLSEKIDALQAEVRQAISNSTAVIDKNKLVSGLGDVFDRYAKQPFHEADLKLIIDKMDEFLRSFPQKIPVQLAQEIKQAAYRNLGDKAYGLGLKPEVLRDTEKALARTVKEEIEKAVPSVNLKNLNAQDEALINAKIMTAARAMKAHNMNELGLGLLNPKVLAAWLVDRDPLFKSLIARGAYGMSKIPTSVGRGMGAGLGTGFEGMVESSRQQQ